MVISNGHNKVMTGENTSIDSSNNSGFSTKPFN